MANRSYRQKTSGAWHCATPRSSNKTNASPTLWIVRPSREGANAGVGRRCCHWTGLTRRRHSGRGARSQGYARGSPRVDRTVRSLYRRGRMRKQYGTGFCSESRRGRECRCGGQGGWIAAPVSQLRLCFRWKENYALRDERSAESAECVRTNQGGGGDSTPSTAAGLLHRQNVVAVRSRREVFSRYDIKTRGKPPGT